MNEYPSPMQVRERALELAVESGRNLGGDQVMARAQEFHDFLTKDNEK